MLSIIENHSVFKQLLIIMLCKNSSNSIYV